MLGLWRGSCCWGRGCHDDWKTLQPKPFNPEKEFYSSHYGPQKDHNRDPSVLYHQDPPVHRHLSDILTARFHSILQNQTQ